MLKKKTPKTIDATLNLKAQGESFKLRLTYRNIKADEYDKLVAEATEKGDGDSMRANAILADSLITEWESEYEKTVDGLLEANADRPFLILALLGGFFDARAVEKVKN